jgi:proline dehydrogenase
MILRNVLLYLSKQKQLRSFVETSAVFRGLTSRFVAGHTLERALYIAEKLNREGLLVSLDYLGENVRSAEEAAGSRDAYLQTLEGLAHRDIESSVSIKPTQFGLDISEETCRENVQALCARTAELGRSVEVDMESHEYVDRTLDLVQEMHERFGRVRAVVQSYLRRTAADVERLNQLQIPVRLCKGAYSEPPEVAFPEKRDVDANYVAQMKILLDRGNYPGLATHDERIVGEAVRFVQERRIPPERFEFQMLYGIRRDLQSRLLQGGFRLRLYVPYGNAWYPYFMRRLAERPANLLFVARNVFRQ